jgi:hypothetical protein
MKNGIVTDSLPHGYYVLKIDGRVSSTHRRYMDAVRAALQLKDQFPQHDIKVGVTQARNSTQESLPETGFALA